MTFGVLIADDEPLARGVVRSLLRRHGDFTIVGECRTGREVVRALDETPADLLFLDVEMPELNAFGALEVSNANPRPLVVFVTAYDEFAVRAFGVEALDYLVKPFTDERFDARWPERAAD